MLLVHLFLHTRECDHSVQVGVEPVIIETSIAEFQKMALKFRHLYVLVKHHCVREFHDEFYFRVSYKYGFAMTMQNV